MGVRVLTAVAVRVGRGVDVFGGIKVLVGSGAPIDVAVLTGVRLGGPEPDPPGGGCPSGRTVALSAPAMGTDTTVPVVDVMVPGARIARVTVCEAVEEGTGVAVEATAGGLVGVKNRSANASRVRARSIGVAVTVNRGVRTISGRVSSLSPPINTGR